MRVPGKIKLSVEKNPAHPLLYAIKMFLCQVINWSIIIIVIVPLYLVIRTIVTIGQPLFYKIEMAVWKRKQKEGVFVGPIPRYWTIMGIPPWYVHHDMVGEEDDDVFD